ncbi:CHASE3 domain-containing protein [Iodidimonas sp. SYSU 1G8]|uniref:CHASE3 domain-containing protein n=1 Tax=Iodidimonas sp. SYSU 1G8 TaxID=3133967 RepID=UPI0031FEA55E
MRSILPLIAGFMLLVAIVVTTGALVATQERMTERVRVSLELENGLWRLLSSLQDAETGQRGYLLTDDESYLVPYKRAAPLIDDHFRALYALAEDRPGYRGSLDQLADVTDRRMAAMNTVIALHRSGNIAESTSLIRAGEGKRLMDEVRVIIARLKDAEAAALDALKERHRQAVLRMQLAVLTAVVAVCLLAAYSIYDAYRRNRGLVQARNALATANSRLTDEIRTRASVEEQLRHSQKLEAMGQLTGGLAHDFNNMLAVVIGNLNLLRRRLARGETDVERYAVQALEGAERATTLTHRLLAFARKQALSPEPLEINRLVSSLSEMLSRTLGEAIRIETVLAGGLWTLHADPGQLESAILNLAVNARDAMPQGGKLTIETANAHLDDLYAAGHVGVPAGQYVMLAITDTGTGMPEEVIARAFDPFFTTKEAGKGTGLGLSQVHGFVYQSGGHVKIYSEAGAGTTVKIYLPRHYGVRDAGRGDKVLPHEVPQGHPDQIILVVEDDERVRRMSVDALRDLGYTVIHADSAARGLTLLDGNPGIVLLFTDIVMPEINGRQLADMARQRRPGLKVLFTTGYTRNAVVHNGIVDPGVHLIGKPFTLEQLAIKIHEVIRSVETA